MNRTIAAKTLCHIIGFELFVCSSVSSFSINKNEFKELFPIRLKYFKLKTLYLGIAETKGF